MYEHGPMSGSLFFFQAEDGIRDVAVTGVQTCALPISMAEKKLQPIIIKRVKKTAHAPHGGAWKIAYADFVTAMMAFFLLMWLLGSTAKGELQGIAAYFSSPLKVAMAGGDGAGNSSSVIPGGGHDLAKVHGQV